jgi:flagella basal body P-ring formation protein FlgA
VAAVIVFAASLAGTSHPGQHWVVATRSLGPGSVLEPGDLTTSTMRLSPATAALAYHQAVSVEGRTLAVGLHAGELVQVSMLVPSSQKPVLRPVSLAVDPVSLHGLYAGQPVDVLMTQGTGNTAGVTVVVRGATLLDVVTSSTNVLAPGSSGQVTIGVSTLSEVGAVVAAAHTGTVTLVAAEPSDGSGPGPGSTAGPDPASAGQ